MTVYAAAPLVVAPDEAGQVRYYYEGSVIPYLSAADRDRLLGDGLVVDVDEDEVLMPVDAVPETGAVTNPVGADVAGGLARPKQTADKDDWVAYAVSRGIAEEEAKAMTKPQLIAAATAE